MLNLLLEFKSQGMTSILISHKLNEIAKVADKITIIRDGSTVETLDCRKEPISEGRIIKGMVGREMTDRYPPRSVTIGEELFRIDDWRVEHPQHAGPRGHQGREPARAARRGRRHRRADGRRAHRTGDERVRPRLWPQHPREPRRWRAASSTSRPSRRRSRQGLAYVTEDRKVLGLVLTEEVRTNITLANLEGVSERGVIDEAREVAVASRYRQALRIRTPSIHQRAINLSGGNQQKVVLSKWLFTEPKVLILDEPTRGIDVGAKYEIYGIINELAGQGKGVIVISSEMPELLGVCDRIYVMNEGRFVDEMPAKEASQEKIMASIMRQYGTQS